VKSKLKVRGCRFTEREYLDITEILPEKLASGKKVLWKEIDKEKIEIFVDKNSARGGNAKPIRIKRVIPINTLLFEGLGLWFGDGLKLQGGVNRKFDFSNTSIELVKYFLEFSEKCLGIKSNEFKVELTVPPELKDKIEEIENCVSSELKIPRENFSKTRVLEQTNKPVVNVVISSRLLGLVVNLLNEKLKQEVLFLNQEFCAAMLRGIIASEGNVKFAYQSNRLGEISIAGKEKVKREFIRELLINLNILPDRDKEIEGQECVVITGLSNFKLMAQWKLCELQPEKKERFEMGIKNFKKEESRKGELRLKILQLLAKNKRTCCDLADALDRSVSTIYRRGLKILVKQGYVERGELVKRVRIWKITKNGLEILKLPPTTALEILRKVP
jgi:DNA-binding transcriptional ArsR family regulator